MKRFFLLIIFSSLFIGSFILINPYLKLFLSKDKCQLKFDTTLLNLKLVDNIPFSQLGGFLLNKGYIVDKEIINDLIFYKKYNRDTLRAGKYLIKKEWSNNKLVNQLYLMRNQNIIDLYIPSVNNIYSLAGKVADQTLIDSAELIESFNNIKLIKDLGFNENSFPTFFLPNTFEVYSNIDIETFFNLLSKSYKLFWNKERKAKANNIGLSQSEITILASIVQMEQQVRTKEHSKIAGLYINRLNIGMKLQADPTVKFAINQPKLKRVLNRHLKHDSPYNTYLYKGLPPGPICIPEITAIDAVLNYKKHDFIYMCAEPTYTGYHNFAETYEQHMDNYKLYKNWLNKEGIR